MVSSFNPTKVYEQLGEALGDEEAGQMMKAPAAFHPNSPKFTWNECEGG